MCATLLFIFIGIAVATPQGYNYQNGIVTSLATNNDFTAKQLQIVQEILQQQQLQLQEHQLKLQQLQQEYQQNHSKNQGVDNNGAAFELAQSTQLTTEASGSHEGFQYGTNNQFVELQAQRSQQQQQHQIALPIHKETQQENTKVIEAHLQAQQLQQSKQQQQSQVQSLNHEQHFYQSQPQLEPQVAPEVKPETFLEPALQPPLIQQQNILNQNVESQQRAELLQPATTVDQHTPTLQHAETQEQHSAPVEYRKQFFFLSAPQEEFDAPIQLPEEVNTVKKNLRVLFIRAPEQNGLTKAALQLAQQSHETQTAIYVLSKQHSIGDLANKLQQMRQAAQTKPEVVFVKYKTSDEAEHAQRVIQAEYEKLSGPNNFDENRVAPTQSFIGSTSEISDQHPSTPGSQYLPPPV